MHICSQCLLSEDGRGSFSVQGDELEKVYKSHFYWGPHVYGGLKRTEWTDEEGRGALRATLFISENKEAGEATAISERCRVSGGVACVRSLWMPRLVTEESAKSAVGKCHDTKLFQGGFWNNLTDPGLLRAPMEETRARLTLCDFSHDLIVWDTFRKS